jgi:hypothetical protein
VSRRRDQRKKRSEPPDGVRDKPKEVLALPRHYRLGRFLQFVGLMILPFGIVSELVGRVGLGQSLLIAGGGALLFYVGYVVQNRA